jgi:DNA-binding transcriptional LysR family regulator
MDTLHNMRVFVRVVEAGSLTAAGHHLNATTTQVSRSISDLERHLRTRLLNRTTRRIALTEAGERYLQRCEQIFALVEQAEAEVGDAQAKPAGTLKVHSMTGFGQHYIVPAISRYRERYPDVRVELTLSQRTPDLLHEGFDVSLTVATESPDSGLMSQRLGSAFSIACASPAYLKHKGTPLVPGDLTRHNCLQLVKSVFPANEWTFDGPNGKESVALGSATLRINIAEALAVAVQEGMGVGLLPAYSIADGLQSGKIVRILPEYTSQQMNAYALYPSRQYLDAKIRTWIDFLRDELPSALNHDQTRLRNAALGQDLAICGFE